MRNALLGVAIVAVLVVAGCNPDREATREMSNVIADATNGAVHNTGVANDSVAVAEAPATNAAVVPAATPMTDRFVGRWTGVEGLYLDVATDAAKGPGHYKLTMQYGLDETDKGTFDGVFRDGAIRFTRPDGEQALRPTDGAATGLRYLDGKADCLTVKEGEGYCRR